MTLQHEQLGARRRAATPDRGAPTRRVLGAVLAGALATSLSACGGPGDVVEITKTRVAAVPSKTALPGADVRSRLGMRNRPDGPGQGQAAPSPQDAGSLFDFDLPEGWEELAPTQFRLVNLRSKSDPTAEITLRSEEHTSELQSQSTISYAVFCLKKKKKKKKLTPETKTNRLHMPTSVQE